MTEPAVLQATYSDFKLIKTRSVISLGMELPIEHADQVMKALGMPVPGSEITVAICRLNLGAARHGKNEGDSHSSENPAPESASCAPPPKGPHSDYAQKLYQSYFMRSEKVCEALGSDDVYRSWIQKQPSCVSGLFDYSDHHEMCEAAHVRRAATSGTGYKPPYSCVPLLHEEHREQHQHGEDAALSSFGGIKLSVSEAKEWFDKRALEYREKWVRERLCAVMGVDSLTDIDPEKLRIWCESKGVEEALPK